MPFIVRHAGGTINREQIGADEMTAHKRLRGKEFKKEIPKIGGCVWLLQPKSKGKMKADYRWLNGIWLGVREESGEYIIDKDLVKKYGTGKNSMHSKGRLGSQFQVDQELRWPPTSVKKKNLGRSFQRKRAKIVRS